MHEKKHCRRLTTLGAALAILLGLFVFSDSYASSYTLTLTSSGSQNINVTADTGSTISADSINVTTNCRYGYNLTLSTSVNDNNLYLNGNSSNNTAGTYFLPTDGTSALNATTNMWGYYYNGSTTPASTSVFSPVPTLASPATVKTPLTTPASSDINDSFNIYYGVSVSPTMAKGTYKMIPDTNNSNNDGTLVYTATIADNCTKYTVNFNPTSTANNTTISGTGTMSPQSIYEGVATNLNPNTFTAPSGYAFKEWNTAQDGTGTSYADEASVTDLTTVGNSITLYAQWDIGPLDENACAAGYICYAPNSGEIEGSMRSLGAVTGSSNAGKTNVDTSATEATLIAPNYSREGYGFAGWSTDFNATSSSTIYGPNETITLATDGTGDADVSENGLILYPVWIESRGTIQNWTDCSSLTQVSYNSTTGELSATLSNMTALTDSRDSNVYTVARLADGNCWMTENLRLDAGNSSSSSLAQGFGGVFIGLDTSENTNFEGTTNATSTGLYSATNVTGDYNGYRIPRYNNNNTNRNLRASYNGTGSTTYYQWYGYGNYYNWPAAMASTNQFTYYSTSDVAGTSICPKGWRLPYGDISDNGNRSGGFTYLNTQMGGTVTSNSDSTNTVTGITMSYYWRKFPNNFVFSGYLDASSAWFRSGVGRYWSSTSRGNEGSRLLTLTSSSINTGTENLNKGLGMTLRCLAGS